MGGSGSVCKVWEGLRAGVWSNLSTQHPLGRMPGPWATAAGLGPHMATAPDGHCRVGDGVQIPRPRRGASLLSVEGYLGATVQSRGLGCRARANPGQPRGAMAQALIMSELGTCKVFEFNTATPVSRLGK